MASGARGLQGERCRFDRVETSLQTSHASAPTVKTCAGKHTERAGTAGPNIMLYRLPPDGGAAVGIDLGNVYSYAGHAIDGGAEILRRSQGLVAKQLGS